MYTFCSDLMVSLNENIFSISVQRWLPGAMCWDYEAITRLHEKECQDQSFIDAMVTDVQSGGTLIEDNIFGSFYPGSVCGFTCVPS